MPTCICCFNGGAPLVMKKNSATIKDKINFYVNMYLVEQVNQSVSA